MISSQRHSKTLTIHRIVGGVRRRIATLLMGVVSLPAKVVYGNSSGFKQNFGPRRELRRLRETFVGELPNLNRELHTQRASELLDNGFLMVERIGDAAQIARIIAMTSEYLERSDTSVASPNGATRFIVNPLGRVRDLRLFLSEDVCRTIAAYYECALRVESVRVWRNYHVPDIDGDSDDRFSNTFHNDNCPVTGLRVFVLLKDGVTRDTGAFRFHDKRTSRNLMRSIGYFHRNALPSRTRKRLVDERTIRYFEGNAGDVCICNTQECLHAASVPKKGTYRDILQFEVYPAAGPYRHGDELFAAVPPDKEVDALARSIGMETA